MKEEVLEKYRVDESKRDAYKGISEPSEYRIVQKVKKYQHWREQERDCFLAAFLGGE